MAGCSTALDLAERGYRVVLLEGQRIGWGASGRSGGQAITGYACGQEALERQVGFENARRMWDISVEGLRLLRERVERHSIACDLHWGQIHVALKRRQRDELLHELEQLETRYQYPHLQFVEREGVETLLATKRYCAGVYDRGSGHLHPLNYTLGLAGAARKLGATIHEQTRALRIERSSPPVVHTPNGSVRCRYLVLCGNVYLDGVAPELARTIMGVGT
ncbi:MAG: NAD(P)/FAD-dependent oxidoreductase, partial [Steroidobacteraceae bacterium]